MILNRAAQSPKEGWPSTVHAVVVQPYQFSSFNKGDAASVTWPLEKNTADWNAWLEIQQMIDSPLLADPTQGGQIFDTQDPEIHTSAELHETRIGRCIGIYTFTHRTRARGLAAVPEV